MYKVLLLPDNSLLEGDLLNCSSQERAFFENWAGLEFFGAGCSVL